MELTRRYFFLSSTVLTNCLSESYIFVSSNNVLQKKIFDFMGFSYKKIKNLYKYPLPSISGFLILNPLPSFVLGLNYLVSIILTTPLSLDIL